MYPFYQMCLIFLKLCKYVHPAIQVAREKESCGIIPAAGGSTGRHFVVPLDPVSAALNSIPSCDFSACVKAQDHFKRSFKRKE